MLSKNALGEVPCLILAAKGDMTEFVCTSGEEMILDARASVEPVVLWENTEKLIPPRRDKWDFVGKNLIFSL